MVRHTSSRACLACLDGGGGLTAGAVAAAADATAGGGTCSRLGRLSTSRCRRVSLQASICFWIQSLIACPNTLTHCATCASPASTGVIRTGRMPLGCDISSTACGGTHPCCITPLRACCSSVRTSSVGASPIAALSASSSASTAAASWAGAAASTSTARCRAATFFSCCLIHAAHSGVRAAAAPLPAASNSRCTLAGAEGLSAGVAVRSEAVVEDCCCCCCVLLCCCCSCCWWCSVDAAVSAAAGGKPAVGAARCRHRHRHHAHCVAGALRALHCTAQLSLFSCWPCPTRGGNGDRS